MPHRIAGNATWDGIHPELDAPDRLAAVRDQLPSDDLLAQATETFAALADQTRAKIICALAVTDLNVGELAELVGLTHSAVSHQLRTLRYLRVVRFRKHGSAVYYSLDDAHLRAMFQEAIYHADHAAQNDARAGRSADLVELASAEHNRPFSATSN